MTVLVVAFDGTRVNNADALGSVWTDLGGTKAASEPDFVYQGTAAVSKKVGTSEGGVALDMVATVDYTSGPKVWLAKHIATNSSALNNKGATGGILEIGSGGKRGNYDRYYVVGGNTYPIKGGWLITPIDPNGTPSATPGTAPTLTAIDYYGWACDFNATSKAENVAMDAVDYVTNGTGLTISLGTGADPVGTFADITAWDEGEGAGDGGRYGIISTQDGVLYVTGVLTIGVSATNATEFTDSNQVIVFPEAEFLNSVGFFGIDINLSVSGTVVDISDSVFKSQGTVGGAVDTRPDYGCTGTTGTADYTGCTFQNFRTFTMTSGMTVTNRIFLDGDTITQAGATITGCTFSGGTHGDGDGYLDADDLDLIDNCTFNFSDGHAIEYTGAATDTFTLSDVTFTGYGADATTDAALYNPNTSGTLTIAASGVTGLTVRTASGGTTVVTNAVTIRIEGLTEGSAGTMIAAKTVGTITAGDVILQGLANSSGVIEDTGFNYEGAFDPSGLDVICRVRNQGFPNAAIADDGGAFTDKTTAANSTTTNDMTLLPAVPVIFIDNYLFGYLEQFFQLKLDISTAGTGGFGVGWQYWNGAWSALPGVVDGTSDLSVLGESTVSWTDPGDWVTTTFNSQGPYYYVRFIYDSGSVTIPPVARVCKLDVTRYRPFNQDRTITASGLTVVASWNEDTISTF